MAKKLLSDPALADVRDILDGIVEVNEHQAEAIDAIVEHADALQQRLVRAHDAIAVLYVGKAARHPDGKVDVDAVIAGILGDPR